MNKPGVTFQSGSWLNGLPVETPANVAALKEQDSALRTAFVLLPLARTGSVIMDQPLASRFKFNNVEVPEVPFYASQQALDAGLAQNATVVAFEVPQLQDGNPDLRVLGPNPSVSEITRKAHFAKVVADTTQFVTALRGAPEEGLPIDRLLHFPRGQAPAFAYSDPKASPSSLTAGGINEVFRKIPRIPADQGASLPTDHSDSRRQ